MAKKLSFKSLIVAGLAFLAMPFVASCSGGGGGGNGFDVKWEVAEQAHVTAEGYKSLPTKLEDGADLKFSVETDDGFSVLSVTSLTEGAKSAKKLSLKNGFYSLVISGNTTIAVNVTKAVKSLSITNPTKLDYFAGESLDTTGMIVKAVYADNSEEVIEKGNDGYSVSPSFFVGGETSFEVSYLGQKATVNLNARVDLLVTIDPDGGEIDSAWIANLRSMNLNNFKVENGVISFSYFKDLPNAIALPTADQIEKTSCAFLGWGNSATISNNATESMSFKANWKEELVKLNSLHLVKRDGIPYLILKGNFGTATQVYFYLYEGNADIELKDETIAGQPGEAFEFDFDLRKLSDKGAEFEGKWMDIKFVAENGNEKKVMELYTTDSFEMDLGESVTAAGNVYAFQTYTPDGSSLTAIKIVFSSAGDISYKLNFENGNIIFDGVCKLAGTAGKTFRLSWWMSSEVLMGEATIADDGKFQIVAPLSMFDETMGGEGYCHYTVLDGETIIAGGPSSDLSYLVADNTYSQQTINGNAWKAFSYEYDGKIYYFGSRWTVLMVTCYDASQVVTASLEKVNNVVNVKLNFPLKDFTAEDLHYGYDLQSNGNDGQAGDWSYPYIETDDGTSTGTRLYEHEAVVGTDKFTVLIPISNVAGLTDGVIYGIHLWFTNEEVINASGDIKGAEFDASATLTEGSHSYKLFADSTITWNNLSVLVEAA